ncbi:thioredoxin TrxC, partial [Escherichia sp. R-CC3]
PVRLKRFVQPAVERRFRYCAIKHVDFWAPWCGPCRNFAPIFEDVAQERSGKVRFVKVNTEAERELSSRFGIRSIPTIMIFKNGQVVDMLNGAVPKAPFDSWLNESL